MRARAAPPEPRPLGQTWSCSGSGSTRSQVERTGGQPRGPRGPKPALPAQPRDNPIKPAKKLFGNSKFAMFRNGRRRLRRSINRNRLSGRRGYDYRATARPKGAAGLGGPTRRKGIPLSETIHLHDLSPAERLLEEAAERGFVEEKELQVVRRRARAERGRSRDLRAALEERDVVVRAEAADVESRPAAAAAHTGTLDPLQLFMDAAGRHKLLTAAEEVTLAKRIERGDAAAKERMINSNLRLVVSIAKRYQGHDVPAAGSDPGGRDRAEPRRGEVRLAQGLQVLDLRDLVDPPGLPARGREPVEDDPDPGARPGAADQAQPRVRGTAGEARPRGHRSRSWRRRRG